MFFFCVCRAAKERATKQSGSLIFDFENILEDEPLHTLFST